VLLVLLVLPVLPVLPVPLVPLVPPVLLAVVDLLTQVPWQTQLTSVDLTPPLMWRWPIRPPLPTPWD